MTYAEMQVKQLRLSVVLAVVFLATMFAVPFANDCATDWMMAPVLGMPFVWFLVGIAFHLEFWTIAAVYTLFSNRWEAEVTDD